VRSALRDVVWTSKDDVNNDVNKQEGSEKYNLTSVLEHNDPTTLPAPATPEEYAGRQPTRTHSNDKAGYLKYNKTNKN
jgi:hypothetical protein